MNYEVQLFIVFISLWRLSRTQSPIRNWVFCVAGQFEVPTNFYFYFLKTIPKTKCFFYFSFKKWWCWLLHSSDWIVLKKVLIFHFFFLLKCVASVCAYERWLLLAFSIEHATGIIIININMGGSARRWHTNGKEEEKKRKHKHKHKWKRRR